ncbi:MAG: glycogen debranching enzyme N-terminal domain-containing protein [Chloroflexi bacterium]|nr:glycogen debranching enzyme N-terminal domain-containing protein [Chloroflexota bacterium]
MIENVIGYPASRLPILRLERTALQDFESALGYEWLVTNGLGSYASGTVLGVDTRRYHGLLIAALQPPAGRTLLLARMHETIEVADGVYPLHAAEYHDGTIHPNGYFFLEGFSLIGTLPTWRYRVGDTVLEKTLWLARGRNSVFVRYKLLSGQGQTALRLAPFVAHRDYHSQTHGDAAWQFDIQAQPESCRIEAYTRATPLWLALQRGRFEETGIWYWRFLHRRERESGLDSLEDLFTPGTFHIELAQGEEATFIATTDRGDLEIEPAPGISGEYARQAALLDQAGATPDDPVRQRLVLAADQFLVQRGTAGRSVIAGYHWFADWGRDTMISLPGLCLATGRAEEARKVLSTFMTFLDQGLLPNRLPDEEDVPEYNTVDATLWLFEAIARYEGATGDPTFVDEILPSLQSIVDWHERGTRHGIAVDHGDGLLRAGAPGLQLTWMDAKVGDWVVTPRCGKPVEVQALWYNALCLLAGWRKERGKDPTPFLAEAEKCRVSFNQRFWNPTRGYCYDVVDGPDGNDPSLRPNQLLAASLSYPVLMKLRLKPPSERWYYTMVFKKG